VTIRRFVENDADAVTELWRRVFPDNPPHSSPEIKIAKKRAVQPELFFVARVGATVAGTVMSGYDGHRGWIYALAVSPELRRRGVGRALVRHAEEALADLGCVKVNLQIRAGNEQVADFYRRLGYSVEERISMGRLLGVTPRDAGPGSGGGAAQREHDGVKTGGAK